MRSRTPIPSDTTLYTRTMEHVHCTGWWEQDELGRQYMEGLIVAIDGTRISGSGTDLAGMFTLEGTVADDGHVRVKKQYLDQHSVMYLGRYDGARRLWGRWQLNLLQGPWEIVLKGGAEDEEHALEAEGATLASIEECGPPPPQQARYTSHWLRHRYDRQRPPDAAPIDCTE